MKAKMLKLAGVKSEKEFYKKFPTEEAFMKVHGKAFKKAQTGEDLVRNMRNPIPEQYRIQPYNPYGGTTLNNASYDPTTKMVGSQTGQVSMADTEQLGFKPNKSIKDLTGEDIETGLQMTSTIGQNVQKVSKAIQEKKKAKQLLALAPVIEQASATRPEQIQRRYVRPEDIVGTGEEQFPIYGTGTNVLAKNGTEIANTFAPNTLYDDLGYEPLNDSERLKQFVEGGNLKKAKEGIPLGLIQEGVNTVGDLAAGIINIGTKRLNKQSQQILGKAAFQSGMQNIQQGQYQSHMKDGGEVSDYEWVSHTWQPQLITKFGEHNVKDLLKPPSDADMLRAGGHLKAYTPPSERAMSTERPDMEEGGELQTHWGGYAEPMSYNPYLPDGGETIMFRGQSHEESDGRGNTGIGITFGDNPVEVERGEPAVKLRDGGSPEDSSLVVYGNLKIPHTLLGDPNAKGKNFKRYVSELSKGEAKQNKLMEKSLTKLDDLEVRSPIDRLSFNSMEMNMLGANMNLKDIAQKKMDAAALQSAMNDTVEEFGLKTSDKGIIQAAKGANIPKAQDGKDLPKLSAENYNYLRNLYEKAQKEEKGPAVLKFQQEYHRLAPEYAKKVLSKEPVTRYGKGKKPPLTNEDLRSNEDSMFGKRTKQYFSAIESAERKPETVERKPLSGQFDMNIPKKITVPEYAKSIPVPKTPVPDKIDLTGIINQVLPYVRPSDAEELDPNQLMGEMFALSQNQLEPVQAQLFQPDLSVPYDISLQDILNENEATFRAQQRMVGYNPAAQSQLAAQKYSANQKVLGEQFRMNQAMKDQVYKENRNLLNQAKLQNLGILDQQYTRQAQAKSTTKATAQEALNSIASKYAQNKLENRTLQTYENLYNYRYDPKFRAMNMNPLVDFEQMIANASPSDIDKFSKAIEEKTKKTKTTTGRNGSIVKALKSI